MPPASAAFAPSLHRLKPTHSSPRRLPLQLPTTLPHPIRTRGTTHFDWTLSQQDKHKTSSHSSAAWHPIQHIPWTNALPSLALSLAAALPGVIIMLYGVLDATTTVNIATVAVNSTMTIDMAASWHSDRT